MNKKIIKYLLLMAIIAGFVLFINFHQKKEMVHIDSSKFEVMNSEKELLKKQFQIYKPLQIAEKFNLSQNPNQNINVIGINRVIRIEKILYTKEYLYMLYSTNLKKGDELPLNLPLLLYKRIEVRDTNSRVLLPVQTASLSRVNAYADNYIIGQRYYTASLTMTDYFEPHDKKKLKKMNKIHDIVLQRVTVMEKGKQFELNDIVLTVDYHSSKPLP